jgi:prevent-host-death family protein
MENKVGIRELKQNPSQIIAKVKQGEAFTVTERGEPVALIVPIAEDPFTRLVQEGKIRLPRKPFGLVEIVPQASPTGLTSEEILAEDRNGF